MSRLLICAVLASSLFAQSHADRAAELAERRDWKGAEAELRKAVEQSPNDPALLTSLGGVLGMQGNLEQANVYLAKAVALKPRDPLLLRNLAANEWQLRRLAEAHRHLDQLLQANPGDQGAVFLLGMVCEAQKDYNRSAALLESIPDLPDRQPEALVALASSYFHTRRRPQARAALRSLAAGSAQPQVLFMGGRVAMEAQEYAIAESLYTRIRSTYPDTAALSAQLALAQYRAGHSAESEKTLRETVAVGRANRESYVLLCKVLADRGEYNEGLRFADEAARRFPDSPESFSTRGAMEMKLQDYAAAVVSLRKAAELSPSSAALRELALAEWRAGNRPQAAAGFEDAMRRFPRDAGTFEVYGTLLLEDASPEARMHAMELFARALTIDDRAVEARYQLANAALADGRLTEALDHLQKGLKSARDDSRLHFTLSRVYRRMGRDADADREMDEYRRLKK